MAKNVTMKDIAKEMGVSTVTVSKALSGREGVSDEVRRKVIEKAENMGYQYSHKLVLEERQESQNVGIVVANRYFEDNSFYSNLYRNVVLKLNDKDCFGMIEIISEAQEKKLQLPGMVTSGKVAGLIVLGQLSEDYLKMVHSAGIPHIFLDFYNDEAGNECVISDGNYGSYCLTNYLYHMGHREIAYVGSIRATSSIMDRYLGYLKSVLEHDLKTSPEWLIEDRDEKGQQIPFQLPQKMPTAFVCNCDLIACQLIKELNAKGYRVPEDVSVVGFDDYIYSTLSSPQLTTFRVNVPQMASITVSGILKKIKDNSYSLGRRVVGGSVVIRDSVKDFRK